MLIKLNCKIRKLAAWLSFEKLDTLSLIACVIWFVRRFLTRSLILIGPLKPILHLIIIALIFFVEMLRYIKDDEAYFRYKYSKQILLIFLLISLINFYCSEGSTEVFDLVCLLYTVRSIKLKRFVKYILLASSITVIFIVACSQFGLIENYQFADHRGIRYGLGFQFCTHVSHAYFNIMILYFLLKDKLNIYNVLAILALCLTIYSLTYSRNSSGCTLLLTICYVCLHWKNIFPDSKVDISVLFKGVIDNCGKIVSKIQFIFLALMSYLFTILYSLNIPLFEELNKTMSGRLCLQNKFLNEYDVTLFGQHINTSWSNTKDGQIFQTMDSGKFEVLDNGYLNTLLTKGLIIFLIVLFLYTLLFMYSYKRKDYMLFCILFILSLQNAIDPLLLSAHFNSSIFLISIYLPWSEMELAYERYKNSRCKS